LKLEDTLKNKIIGQDEAIHLIASAIRRSRTGVSDEKRPIGSFIFLGPTGVGKTELAKVLASEMFGSEENLIKIDMSEFMEKHNVSRLVGAPAGYVGFDEGGQLTEKIRRNPYSVILFDEIEKAHKDVYNILLQLLDEGHITDSFGRKINFTNTLIILTSNIGSKRAQEFGTSVGFNVSSLNENETKKTIIHKELKKHFNPEFLNRIDGTIMFNPLGKEELKEIIRIEIRNLVDRLKEKDYQIEFDESVLTKILELNSEEDYGARPIKRIIQNFCEDFLSEEILKDHIPAGKTVKIKCDKDGELVVK